MSDAVATQEDLFDVEQELDLTNAGLQRQRATFEITGATVNKARSGRGNVLHIEFTSTDDVDDIPNFRADDYIVVTHDDIRVVKGGQTKLKRLFSAVFGGTVGRISDLPGQFVSAEVWEDDEGFRRIGRYQAIDEGTEEASESGFTLS